LWKLEQNYRSTQLILDAAHAVVTNNSSRKDKKLWTENSGGRPISRFEAYNEEEEAEWIARQIEELTGGRGTILTRRADEVVEHWERRDIAVMYRTNAQSRAIEEAFLRYSIRYQLVGGTLLSAPRGQGRAGVPADPAQRHRPGQLRAGAQRPGPGIGEKSLEELRRFVAAGADAVAGADHVARPADEAAAEAADEEARPHIGRRSTPPPGAGSRPSALAHAAPWAGSSPSWPAANPDRRPTAAELLDAVLEESGYRACSRTAPKKARSVGPTSWNCGL